MVGKIGVFSGVPPKNGSDHTFTLLFLRIPMNSPEIPWDESDNNFEKSQKSPKNDKKEYGMPCKTYFKPNKSISSSFCHMLELVMQIARKTPGIPILSLQGPMKSPQKLVGYKDHGKDRRTSLDNLFQTSSLPETDGLCISASRKRNKKTSYFGLL